MPKQDGAAHPINDETQAGKGAGEGKRHAKPPGEGGAEGMRAKENRDQAPSGALDHGGAEPAMQRSKFPRQ